MFGTGSAQDEYFWLVGKVVGQFAQVEQCLNDVLAGERGLFRDEVPGRAA
jgi:hypothetical protein